MGLLQYPAVILSDPWAEEGITKNPRSFPVTVGISLSQSEFQILVFVRHTPELPHLFLFSSIASQKVGKGLISIPLLCHFKMEHSNLQVFTGSHSSLVTKEFTCPLPWEASELKEQRLEKL
jgi:hypothetical protein